MPTTCWVLKEPLYSFKKHLSLLREIYYYLPVADKETKSERDSNLPKIANVRIAGFELRYVRF